MIFGYCIAELSDSDLKDPCSNEGKVTKTGHFSDRLIIKLQYFKIEITFSVLNMRFGSECEEKKPINPMALAIISQISNKSTIFFINRITYTPFSEWTV